MGVVEEVVVEGVVVEGVVVDGVVVDGVVVDGVVVDEDVVVDPVTGGVIGNMIGPPVPVPHGAGARCGKTHWSRLSSKTVPGSHSK